MSKSVKNEKISNAERLEKLKEAIRGLESEIAEGAMKADGEHSQHMEESVQNKMSQVEQSVANLQKEVKGSHSYSKAVLEAMPANKIIKFSFELKELSPLGSLESPSVDIGGAKWSIYVSLGRRGGGFLSIYLRCYRQSEVISHDTFFTIIFQGIGKDCRKEFIHHFKTTSDNYEQDGFDEIMTSDRFINYEKDRVSFDTDINVYTSQIDLTILQSTVIKHPQEVVDEFCLPTSFPSDCVLIVDGKKIYVNRGLLSVQSTVFNTLFNGNFAEKDSSEIVMEDLDATDFCQFLQVIYPSKYREIITAKNVVGLLKMADRFDVGSVLDRCEQFLRDSSDCFSYARKMLIAQEYSFNKLLVFCIAQYKSVEHLKKLIKEPEYPALNDKTVRMLFHNIGRC